MSESIEFKATITKKVGEYKNDFRIYGCMPTDIERKDIQYNKYGNVSLSGEMHDLSLNTEYTITAFPSKYGYTVTKISRDKPSSAKETSTFLKGIVTENQAITLLEVYPNIVEKIINNDLDDVDLSLTKGIKENKFNKIKEKVIENFPLMDFIETFNQYDITIGMAKKMYDTFASIELMIERMNTDPYSTLCLIGGVGFKKADNMILTVPENTSMVNSLQRMKACMKFVLNENENNGNTWISLDSLSSKCYELVPECLDFLLESLKDESIYIEKETRRIAYKKTYNIEVFIAETLFKMSQIHNPLIIDASKYYRANGCESSDEQRGILSQTCNNSVGLLVGNGGSGKSFSMQLLINMCDDNNLKYMLMTPTGKSAIVLSNFTKRDAGTIHRKLEFNPVEGWGFNENNKLDTDVVIVDENGMTDIFLMQNLLNAIDIYKTRIVFVQDDAQLPSVSCGNCAYDFINSGVIATTRLTKIFRYGEGGLLQIATKIRNGEKFIDNNCNEIMVYGDNKDYTFIPAEDNEIADYVISIYERLLSQGAEKTEILVLTGNNVGKNGTIELNKILQEKFNPYKEGCKFVKYGENIYMEKDIVMQNKNNYKATNEDGKIITITNGEIGEIIRIEWDNVYIKYDRDVIVYDKSDLSEIQLAYSITIHKSQGSSIDYTILATPVSQKWTCNRNLLYVGSTRARKKCFHIGLPSTVNHALKSSIELQRNTFIIELLKNMKKELDK